ATIRPTSSRSRMGKIWKSIPAARGYLLLSRQRRAAITPATPTRPRPRLMQVAGSGTLRGALSVSVYGDVVSAFTCTLTTSKPLAGTVFVNCCEVLSELKNISVDPICDCGSANTLTSAKVVVPESVNQEPPRSPWNSTQSLTSPLPLTEPVTGVAPTGNSVRVANVPPKS